MNSAASAVSISSPADMKYSGAVGGWMDQEMAIVRPKLVVALGTTAAREIAGRPITISRERGRLIRFGDGRNALATVHPAAILRIREENSRNDTYKALIVDLKRAKGLVEDELKAVKA